MIRKKMIEYAESVFKEAEVVEKTLKDIFSMRDLYIRGMKLIEPVLKKIYAKQGRDYNIDFS